jgi:hypothetical protein
LADSDRHQLTETRSEPSSPDPHPEFATARGLLESYLAEASGYAQPRHVRPDDCRSGVAIMDAAGPIQVAVVQACLDKLDELNQKGRGGLSSWFTTNKARWDLLLGLVHYLMARRLPYQHHELHRLLEFLVAEKERPEDGSVIFGLLSYLPFARILQQVERYATAEGLTPELRSLLTRLRPDALSHSADKRFILRIDAILKDAPRSAPQTTTSERAPAVGNRPQHRRGLGASPPKTRGGRHSLGANGEHALPPSLDAGVDQLLDGFLAQTARVPAYWMLSLKEYDAGLALLRAGESLQVGVIHAAAERLRRAPWNGEDESSVRQVFALVAVLSQLLERPLDLTVGDLQSILPVVVNRPAQWNSHLWLMLDAQLDRILFGVLNRLAHLAETQELPSECRALLNQFRSSRLRRESVLNSASDIGLITRIDALLGNARTAPYETGEPWVDRLYTDLAAPQEPARSAWNALLEHARTAEPSKPSEKWRQRARGHLAAVGVEGFKPLVHRWFEAMSQARGMPLSHWNTNVVKGLVWSCSLLDDAPLSRSLGTLAEASFKKIGEAGLWSEKVGNACIYALGIMPGQEPIAQLARLRQRVRHRPAQAMIAKALDAAAERVGLSRQELEEIVVPTCGLDSDGRLRTPLGRFTAEITVSSLQPTQWSWRTDDGRLQKSVPAEVKQQHADELKALMQTVADIEKMLPAQRDRIEALLRTERSWALPAWRERYLDHPLVGSLARRLIWHLHQGDRTALGIWHEGSLVDRESRPLDWLTDRTEVRLWHPIGFEPETVLQWRVWLEEHGVTQPFKQAHREVYLLTDAELNTGTYSNRFAAHLLKQHQFKALCDQKGWQYRLELVYDGGSGRPVATLPVPQWGLSAEFWVEPAGGEESWTPAGAYLYVSTDQVRFCTPDGTPRPLTEVPALAFTEVMRDVDLFVGVASVGNDPAWVDSGGAAGYRDYWREYAFGDLSASAKTRGEVLERLLPRLKIAGRCSLDGRFLKVRGDLRSYKIHLGSGNILMEPNDQYLCIVTDRSSAAKADSGALLLPFEGDRTLSLILSKAFLLADDAKIKDVTILSQIRRS